MRRTGLLLAAILIPTAVVILLVVRVVRQERELGERRASDARREAQEQLRRELTAHLQAIRLEEVNRLIGESGTRLPPDSPIVFVAPMAHDDMVRPWEGRPTLSPPSAGFLRLRADGESLEFQRHDAAGAAASYQRAFAAARTPLERCTARVSLGRAYLKAGMALQAASMDEGTLADCSNVADADGVTIAMYAAERLLDSGRDRSLVTNYAVHAVNARQWPSPNETYALRSLLHRMPSAVAAEPLWRLTLRIHDIEQVDALARELQAHPDRLQRASRTAPGDLPWMGYGDEPWLVTLVSPTSFAAPVVMAVSSRRSIPAGVALRAAPAPAAVPLGDGFVDSVRAMAAGTLRGPASDAGRRVRGAAVGCARCSLARRLFLAARCATRERHRVDAIELRRQRLARTEDASYVDSGARRNVAHGPRRRRRHGR